MCSSLSCLGLKYPDLPLHSVFVVDSSNDVPEELTSFVRLLMMSAPEWEKAKRKSKLPKPKDDEVTLSVTADVVSRRLTEYPTTIEVSLPERCHLDKFDSFTS